MESQQRVVLDLDSTEIPVYGQQEQSAYNGHVASTCYHPLLLFNREGDCLTAKLRPGNVHSAEDWDQVLLPEVARQQKQDKDVVVRADAAFAIVKHARYFWLLLAEGYLTRPLFGAILRRLEAVPGPAG
jgi:Transposase DDE domain group 1